MSDKCKTCEDRRWIRNPYWLDANDRRIIPSPPELVPTIMCPECAPRETAEQRETADMHIALSGGPEAVRAHRMSVKIREQRGRIKDLEARIKEMEATG